MKFKRMSDVDLRGEWGFSNRMLDVAVAFSNVR